MSISHGLQASVWSPLREQQRTEKAPIQNLVGRVEVAQYACQLRAETRPAAQPIDGEVHEARDVDERLDQRGQTFLATKGRPPGLRVRRPDPYLVAPAAEGGVGEWRQDLGAAEGAEDALAGEWIEEASGVANQSKAGTGLGTNGVRERPDPAYPSELIGAAVAGRLETGHEARVRCQRRLERLPGWTEATVRHRHDQPDAEAALSERRNADIAVRADMHLAPSVRPDDITQVCNQSEAVRPPSWELQAEPP
jgi:hypothetical protein